MPDRTGRGECAFTPTGRDESGLERSIVPPPHVPGRLLRYFEREIGLLRKRAGGTVGEDGRNQAED
jgi:hypothetical protein